MSLVSLDTQDILEGKKLSKVQQLHLKKCLDEQKGSIIYV